MTIELSSEEKRAIIEQHIKTLAYAEYNNMLSLIELNAVSNPDQNSIDNLNNQIAKTEAQKAALQNELNSLDTNITES